MSPAEVCFVIAPFREPFESYHRQILIPAIEAAGLRPIRGDDIHRPGSIVNQIWEELCGASVCVAELTGQNANVMYELGLAHAIGKPVAQIVQSMDDVPFDLRHLRTIVYDTQKVRWDEQLSRDVERTLGEIQAEPASSLALPYDPVATRRQVEQVDKSRRRAAAFERLRAEYILSHDGISAELMAGTVAPPQDWMERRIRELGWQHLVD